MSDNQKNTNNTAMDAIYAEAGDWHLNVGGETIHAKRMNGFFRNVKYWTSSVWLIFFFGAYIRWNDHQAILFDIPARQFHIFSLTILPQDFWMFALVMLFFALLLAISTATMGRVFCGFFCFQTIWTDLYTWIEAKLEGTPQKRKKLDKAPLNFKKIKIKVIKHSLWLMIAAFTGISFIVWFTDAYHFWYRLIRFDLTQIELIILTMFTAGTYFLAGFMREQTCFWLCPYARIQGVMIDNSTAVVTYDVKRGEPRGRLKKNVPESNKNLGDCVDCKQCIAVCPTGIDIRQGQQEGCINCALCIDACDTVMDKLGREKHLISYRSLDQINKKEVSPLWKRPRILVYSTVLVAALTVIAYGLLTIESVELKILHERQPLFVLESSGNIRNKYKLKVLNKVTEDINVTISVKGLEQMKLIGAEKPFLAKHSGITAHTVYIEVPQAFIKKEMTPIIFTLEAESKMGKIKKTRKNMFIGPK